MPEAEPPRPIKERLIRVFTRHKLESSIFAIVGAALERFFGISEMLF